MRLNQIKVGVILSYFIVVLSMAVGLVYTPILVRKLGQSEYGLYSLIASIISYLTILDLGFGNAIVVYTTRYRAKKQNEEESKLHGMFIFIYTIIGVVASIIGIILYFNIDNMFGNTMTVQELSKAKVMMIILTFNLIITFPFSVFGNIIIAYEKFIFSKLVKILQILLVPCIMIPALFLGYKSITMVLIITITNIICLLINTYFCFKKLKLKILFRGFDIKILKEIFAYSFFIFLNQIIDKVNWTLDQFVLGLVSGTVTVAIYSIAGQLNMMYMHFSTAISSVMLPKITKMEENKATNEEFTDVFVKIGRIQYIVMALIITGFILFGQSFINIWVGEGYQESYAIACILMIPITIPLIQNIGLSILQAKNKYKYRTMIFFVIAIINILITLILVQRYGGIGAAIGTAIAQILGQIIIMNIYYHKKIHINIIKFWKEIGKMSIPVVFTFIIGLLIVSKIDISGLLAMSVWIIVYSIIYILLMWIFAMNTEEKDLIRKPIKKILKMRGE